MTATHTPRPLTTGTTESARLAEALRASAMAAADQGWHVFPLVPGGNTPAVKGWQERATTDPSRIERCWTPSASNTGTWNIGIACGPSGLLVVDLDVAKDDETGFGETGVEGLTHLAAQHGEIPDTYTVVTPSGGRHLYFTAPTESPSVPPTADELRDVERVQLADPRVEEAGTVMGIDPDRGLVQVAWDSSEIPTICTLTQVRPCGQPRAETVQLGNTVGRLHHEIDTRGIGGYVVGAGSVRPHGAYTASPVRFDGDPFTTDPTPTKTTAALPAWLLTQLRELSDRSESQHRAGLPADEARRRAYLDKVVAGELARVLDSGADRHNESLFIASAHLGELVAAGHLDETTLRAVLVAAGQRVGQPTSEARSTVESGFRNGAKNPRHIDPPNLDGPTTGVDAAGATSGPYRAQNIEPGSVVEASSGEPTTGDDTPANRRYAEDERVRVRYPLPDDDPDNSDTWHWVPAIVVEATDDPQLGTEYVTMLDQASIVEQYGETTDHRIVRCPPSGVRPTDAPSRDHDAPVAELQVGNDRAAAAAQPRPDARLRRFSEDERVQALYPLPGDNRDDRSTWHWLPAIVLEAIDDPTQGEEYLVVIDDDRLAEVGQSGDTTYPSAFRDRGELRPTIKPPDDPPTAAEPATGERAGTISDSPESAAGDGDDAVNARHSSDREDDEPPALSEPVAERLVRSATRRQSTPRGADEAERRNYVEAGVRGLYATELAAGYGEPNTAALARLGQLRGGGYLHPSTVYAATCHCCVPGRSHGDCDTHSFEQPTGKDSGGVDTAAASGRDTHIGSGSGAGMPDDATAQRSNSVNQGTPMTQRSSIVEKARLAAAEFGARLCAAEQRARARTQDRVTRVSSADVRGCGEALSW